MATKLSIGAKDLMGQLINSPEFKEILDYIGEPKPILFKPVKTDETSPVEAQTANWMYHSGAVRENRRIINILSGESNE